MKSGVHACLSRRRSRVRIPSSPPKGQIAQSVEHLSEKQGVGSSILPLATMLKKIIIKIFRKLNRKQKDLFNSFKRTIRSQRFSILNIEKTFSNFVPNSKASYKMNKILTVDNINNLVKNLSELVKIKSDLKIENTTNYFDNNKRSEYLESLFKKYGSDKSTHHNYHLIYSNILDTFNSKNSFQLLEVGLGTQNKNIASNMLPQFKPGGCLRAFNEYINIKNTKLIGIDIDEEILFNTENIECYYGDQSSLESLMSIPVNSLDLIIDDGLHAQYTNINTLIFAYYRLNKGGYLIIEDIHEKSLDTFLIIKTITEDIFEFNIFKDLNAHIAILKKK